MRRCAEFFATCAAASVTAVLTYASVGVVLAERQQGKMLSFGLPTWISESVMPLALGLMTLTYVRKSSRSWFGRAGAVAIVGAVFALGLIAPDGPCHLASVLAAAGSDAARVTRLRCDGRPGNDPFLAGVHAGVGGHR